jgi:hypothetical protein
MKSGCLAVGAVWLASRARSLDERIKAGGTPTGADVDAIAEAWTACKQVLLGRSWSAWSYWTGLKARWNDDGK